MSKQIFANECYFIKRKVNARFILDPVLVPIRFFENIIDTFPQYVFEKQSLVEMHKGIVFRCSFQPIGRKGARKLVNYRFGRHSHLLNATGQQKELLDANC